MLGALRAVRLALDEDFPAIRSTGEKRAVRYDARTIERRLRKRGYVPGDSVTPETHLAISNAGLKSRKALGDWWIPSWAVEVVKDCVRNPPARGITAEDAATAIIRKTKGKAGAIKALLAEIALRRDGETEA